MQYDYFGVRNDPPSFIYDAKELTIDAAYMPPARRIRLGAAPKAAPVARFKVPVHHLPPKAPVRHIGLGAAPRGPAPVLVPKAPVRALPKAPVRQPVLPPKAPVPARFGLPFPKAPVRLPPPLPPNTDPDGDDDDDDTESDDNNNNNNAAPVVPVVPVAPVVPKVPVQWFDGGRREQNPRYDPNMPNEGLGSNQPFINIMNVTGADNTPQDMSAEELRWADMQKMRLNNLRDGSFTESAIDQIENNAVDLANVERFDQIVNNASDLIDNGQFDEADALVGRMNAMLDRKQEQEAREQQLADEQLQREQQQAEFERQRQLELTRQQLLEGLARDRQQVEIQREQKEAEFERMRQEAARLYQEAVEVDQAPQEVTQTEQPRVDFERRRQIELAQQQQDGGLVITQQRPWQKDELIRHIVDTDFLDWLFIPILSSALDVRDGYSFWMGMMSDYNDPGGNEGDMQLRYRDQLRQIYATVLQPEEHAQLAQIFASGEVTPELQNALLGIHQTDDRDNKWYALTQRLRTAPQIPAIGNALQDIGVAINDRVRGMYNANRAAREAAEPPLVPKATPEEDLLAMMGGKIDLAPVAVLLENDHIREDWRALFTNFEGDLTARRGVMLVRGTTRIENDWQATLERFKSQMPPGKQWMIAVVHKRAHNFVVTPLMQNQLDAVFKPTFVEVTGVEYNDSIRLSRHPKRLVEFIEGSKMEMMLAENGETLSFAQLTRIVETFERHGPRIQAISANLHAAVQAAIAAYRQKQDNGDDLLTVDEQLHRTLLDTIAGLRAQLAKASGGQSAAAEEVLRDIDSAVADKAEADDGGPEAPPPPGGAPPPPPPGAPPPPGTGKTESYKDKNKIEIQTPEDIAATIRDNATYKGAITALNEDEYLAEVERVIRTRNADLFKKLAETRIPKIGGTLAKHIEEKYASPAVLNDRPVITAFHVLRNGALAKYTGELTDYYVSTSTASGPLHYNGEGKIARAPVGAQSLTLEEIQQNPQIEADVVAYINDRFKEKALAVRTQKALATPIGTPQKVTGSPLDNMPFKQNLQTKKKRVPDALDFESSTADWEDVNSQAEARASAKEGEDADDMKKKPLVRTAAYIDALDDDRAEILRGELNAEKVANMVHNIPELTKTEKQAIVDYATNLLHDETFGVRGRLGDMLKDGSVVSDALFGSIVDRMVSAALAPVIGAIQVQNKSYEKNFGDKLLAQQVESRRTYEVEEEDRGDADAADVDAEPVIDKAELQRRVLERLAKDKIATAQWRRK